MPVSLTVILPAHNPHPARFRRTLEGLERQTLAPDLWEWIVVDNCSDPPVSLPADLSLPSPHRIVKAHDLGLAPARLAGFSAAEGDTIVLVDDDNVLAPDYLTRALEFARDRPDAGVFGGKSVPEFEVPPPPWFSRADISLGCRDLGDEVKIVSRPRNATLTAYPPMAPIGAGMVLRKAVADSYRTELRKRQEDGRVPAITDRRGESLSSGGDCDIVLTALSAGWAVAYVPALRLTHLIPARRLERSYLKRLVYDSNLSWVRLLDIHGIRPWPAIASWTVAPRQVRAWFRLRAWQGPDAYLRWRGACARLRAQANLPKRPQAAPHACGTPPGSP